MLWLPEPPEGTKVCGGFDGSDSDDHTAIKLETLEGLIFTPRYGPDRLPTIWDPAKWGGRIPRQQVRVAWAEIAARYDFGTEKDPARVYCDPGFHDELSWESEIESWATEWPALRFTVWPTNQMGRMFPALRRFEADLKAGGITHDGCPITAAHMRNARKLAKRGDQYTLAKPSQSQKIDAGVTTVLAHEAASDARAEGWGVEAEHKVIFFNR